MRISEKPFNDHVSLFDTEFSGLAQIIGSKIFSPIYNSVNALL